VPPPVDRQRHPPRPWVLPIAHRFEHAAARIRRAITTEIHHSKERGTAA
jgi:hypothetical protein